MCVGRRHWEFGFRRDESDVLWRPAGKGRKEAGLLAGTTVGPTLSEANGTLLAFQAEGSHAVTSGACVDGEEE